MRVPGRSETGLETGLEGGHSWKLTCKINLHYMEHIFIYIYIHIIQIFFLYTQKFQRQLQPIAMMGKFCQPLERLGIFEESGGSSDRKS